LKALPFVFEIADFLNDILDRVEPFVETLFAIAGDIVDGITGILSDVRSDIDRLIDDITSLPRAIANAIRPGSDGDGIGAAAADTAGGLFEAGLRSQGVGAEGAAAARRAGETVVNIGGGLVPFVDRVEKSDIDLP